MDLSAIMGGGMPQQEQKPAVQYTAQTVSPIVNGEATLTIGTDSFTVAALFDTVEIPFAEAYAIRLADYVVTVRTDGGDYTFSRMGEWAQRFHDALCDAYNQAVLASLFVKGSPVLTAKGDYTYSEDGVAASGNAPVAVYEDCVTILPPDAAARRVPLCFVSGMDAGDYALTLRLDTGEAYTFSKLGYDTAPFEGGVTKAIRAIRERTLAAVKEICPSLTSTQAAQIAKLLPEGAAAPMGTLAAIAPAFVKEVEKKLAGGRAAASYKAFGEMSDPARIHVGLRRKTPEELAAELEALEAAAQAAAEANPDAPVVEVEPPDPFLLWLIAPSPDSRFAAVEFAEENSATYIYRTGGDFEAFARQLNRALEAIGFRREVIRLSDSDLRKPENANFYMAARRTAALRFVRSSFAGRGIHSNPTAWKRKVTELWSDTSSPQTNASPAQKTAKFCGNCGAAITPGVKFCGECGHRFA
jgi:hypothetical protein